MLNNVPGVSGARAAASHADRRLSVSTKYQGRLRQRSMVPSSRRANASRRRELAEWKAQNGLDASTKVFTMDAPTEKPQGDIAVREYLLGEGWHENTATEPPESLLFDLRFQRLRRRASRDLAKQPGGDDSDDDESPSSPMPPKQRQPKCFSAGDPVAAFQLTNHYTQTGCITTKTGLVKTLEHSRFLGNAEPDDFSPRAYCMEVPSDMQTFYDDFRQVAAECVLFGIVERCTARPQEERVNQGLLDVCESICQRKLRALLIDSGDPEGFVNPVTNVEWEVLRAAQRLTVASTDRGVDFEKSGWRGVISSEPIELLDTPEPPEIAEQAEQSLPNERPGSASRSPMVQRLVAKAQAARKASAHRARVLLRTRCSQCAQVRHL